MPYGIDVLLLCFSPKQSRLKRIHYWLYLLNTWLCFSFSWWWCFHFWFRCCSDHFFNFVYPYTWWCNRNDCLMTIFALSSVYTFQISRYSEECGFFQKFQYVDFWIWNGDLFGIDQTNTHKHTIYTWPCLSVSKSAYNDGDVGNLIVSVLAIWFNRYAGIANVNQSSSLNCGW